MATADYNIRQKRETGTSTEKKSKKAKWSISYRPHSSAHVPATQQSKRWSKDLALNTTCGLRTMPPQHHESGLRCRFNTATATATLNLNTRTWKRTIITIAQASKRAQQDGFLAKKVFTTFLKTESIKAVRGNRTFWASRSDEFEQIKQANHAFDALKILLTA